MGYRWKPSKAQKEAYKEKLKEREKLDIKGTPFAIREGCYVEYFNVNQGMVIEGLVTNSSYGKTTGQHTFTIDGTKVKGRNLYPNVISHKQGEISKEESN